MFTGTHKVSMIASKGKLATDGLSLYLNANDNNSYPGTGTTWYDISGNNNNGIISILSANRITYDSNPPKNFMFYGNYGTTDRVYFSNSSFITPSSFTAMCWIRTTDSTRSSGTQGRIAASTYQWNSNASLQRGWYIGTIWVGTDFYFTIQDGTTTIRAGIPADWHSTYLNQWTCVCGVFKSGEYVKFFQNGNLIETTSTALTSLTSGYTGLALGKRNDFNQCNWLGNISQTLYYNRALSDYEIIQNYNATKGAYGL